MLLLLSSLVLGAAVARAGQAELTGEVRDQTGAVIVGAAVQVTDAHTNQVSRTRTSSGGIYTLTHLEPGLYAVTVEAQGFRRFVREDLALATGERRRLDVTLVLDTLS